MLSMRVISDMQLPTLVLACPVTEQVLLWSDEFHGCSCNASAFIYVFLLQANAFMGREKKEWRTRGTVPATICAKLR